MKTKIVYVLVSQKEDFYYEMFLLSLFSLRLHHSREEAEVILVMDEQTYARLSDMRAPVLNDVVPMVVDIPDTFTVLQRSRYLKTKLRDLVTGSFLYLDCDTIICHPLGEVDKFSFVMAAVLDNHFGAPINFQLDSLPLSMAQWKSLSATKHYNGGVLYAKDTERAKAFFHLWHKYWCLCVSNGVTFDQIALRKTASEMPGTLSELNGIWNCQIARDSSRQFLEAAIILHYQGSFCDNYRLCCKETLMRIKLSEKVDDQTAQMVHEVGKRPLERNICLNTQEIDKLRPVYFMYKDHPGFYSFLVRLVALYRRIEYFWRRLSGGRR